MEAVTAEQIQAMDSAQFLAFIGTDGHRWMQCFRALNPQCNVDDDTMLGWFCNAIMAGYDAALGNPPLCGDHLQWMLEQQS